MKNITKYLALCSIMGVVAQVQAQPRPNTWYGKIDAGGSWLADTDLKEVFGFVAPDAEVTFNPGVRFGAGIGYNFTEWFAAEAEVSVNWNEIDTMTGAQRVDANFINAPFMFNAKFQLPNPSRIRPFIGAGVGGASSVLDVDELEYGPVRVWGSASDITFALQGFGGVQVDLSERMSLGVEYRYLWSDAPEFDADWGWYWNVDGRHARFGEIQTHSVSLTFQYQF